MSSYMKTAMIAKGFYCELIIIIYHTEIREQHEMLMMTGRIIVPISDDNREFIAVIKPQQLLLFLL